MIHELLDSLNLTLTHHPNLLQVMHTLFWVKYWALLGIFSVFVYLVMTDEQLSQASAIRAQETAADDSFLA